MLNTICLPKSEVVPHSDDYPFKKASMFGWGLKANRELPFYLQRGDFWVRYDFYYDRFLVHQTDEPISAMVSYMKLN